MSPILFQWINIVVLFSVLGFILKKKLGAHFAAERERLDFKIQTAGSEYIKIKEQFDEIQSGVKNLSKKISDLKNTSLKEIENETKKIEADTARTIDKMLSDGEARLKNEAERTKKNLEKELFAAALVLAKESLQKDMKAGGQDWVSQMVQGDAVPGKKNYAS